MTKRRTTEQKQDWSVAAEIKRKLAEAQKEETLADATQFVGNVLGHKGVADNYSNKKSK